MKLTISERTNEIISWMHEMVPRRRAINRAPYIRRRRLKSNNHQSPRTASACAGAPPPGRAQSPISTECDMEPALNLRSEERRVGKESRSAWAGYQQRATET